MDEMKCSWREFCETPLYVVETQIDIMNIRAKADNKKQKEAERKSERSHGRI